MTDVKSTETAEVPLGRLGLNRARYYLGNRWTLLALGGGVLVAGIGLNWSWLVAAGLAPILLSTLPCLVMCAIGVCSMCRSSETKTTTSQADAATSATPLGIAKVDSPSAEAASCCHEQVGEAKSPQIVHLQPLEERKYSHA